MRTDDLTMRNEVPRARWQALVEAVERLAAVETLDDVIAIVRSKAREISGAEGVTFVLRDGEFCHYIDEDAVGPLWKGKRFPLTACISGWCMLNGEIAVIPDIYVDNRIPHDAYRPTFVNSLVMVPVKAGAAIAAIGSYWSERRNFDEGELELVRALARSTAVAIQSLRMRESLRESEARLRMALEAGDLGAWELSVTDDALVTSPLCRAAFGAGAQMNFAELTAAVVPEERAQAEAAFARAREEGGSLALECRIVRPDGSPHWIELRGRAAADANGRTRTVAGVVRDVTERRVAEERLQQLQSDLAHAGRLTELGQMVSAIGHELRQPLTAATNYLAAATTMLNKLDEVGALKCIDKADAQFRRAQEILDRIRDFARKDETGSQPTDVGQLIAEARELAMIDPKHRGVEVRVDADNRLPKVKVDKIPTQQVLLNLLRNAFEATQEQGRGRVKVRAGLDPARGQVEVSVSDNGPGIAPQVMARLFQPFVTTKPNGMGIGLSICHSIIEAQGGKMWAESQPGNGAKFVMTLPVAAA
jgi:PAS domain S-box-containing protein